LKGARPPARRFCCHDSIAELQHSALKHSQDNLEKRWQPLLFSKDPETRALKLLVVFERAPLVRRKNIAFGGGCGVGMVGIHSLEFPDHMVELVSCACENNASKLSDSAGVEVRG
jgi:hypothetical protein